jgi:hypothetical protein
MPTHKTKRTLRTRPAELCDGELKHQRDRQIDAMATSMIEMFGDGALAIASGQPWHKDVGGNSGICWREVSKAIRG